MHAKQAIVLAPYQGNALLRSRLVPKHYYSPLDLGFNDTPLAHRAVNLPLPLELSGIFRSQSRFHFSVPFLTPVDVDGDGLLNGVGFISGRNHVVFQLLNRANPGCGAAISEPVDTRGQAQPESNGAAKGRSEFHQFLNRPRRRWRSRSPRRNNAARPFFVI